MDEGRGRGICNYRKIAKKLIRYVKQNHFTHIELMPLCEYPFDGSWGYQCSGYFSVTSRYGSCHDLMYLVNEAHKAGIGVIMDFVPVHFVKDDFSLSYFDGTALYEYPQAHDADSQWGTANFDLWKEEVRSFLMSAASFWIDVYHFDGLRMDAISNAIFWHGNKQLGVNEGALNFIKRMNFLLNERYQGKIMLIAEDSTDFPNVTKSTFDGGLGFLFKWNMGWMNDTLRYMQEDPIYRKYKHDLLTFSMSYAFSENYILPLSHDEVVNGKGSLMVKMPGDYFWKFANLRLLRGYQMAHPGKKLSFMGNEFGQFTEWSFHKELDWMLLGYEMHQKMQAYTRDLNLFYKNHDQLWAEDYSWEGYQWIQPNDGDNSVLAFRRIDKRKRELLVVCNFTPVLREDYRLGVPKPGVYVPVFCSDELKYGGGGYLSAPAESEAVSFREYAHSARFRIPPMSVTFFSHKEKKNVISPENTGSDK